MAPRCGVNRQHAEYCFLSSERREAANVARVLRREKIRRVLENKWKLSDEGRRSDNKINLLL